MHQECTAVRTGHSASCCSSSAGKPERSRTEGGGGFESLGTKEADRGSEEIFLRRLICLNFIGNSLYGGWACVPPPHYRGIRHGHPLIAFAGPAVPLVSS
jgi:hypothetical protein